MRRIIEPLKFCRKYFSKCQPLAMIYFVTKLCNAKCAHCFYWESINKPCLNELKINELEKIANSVGKLLYLRLSGGEPFIRKDLIDLVSVFVEKCGPSYVGIPTNGFYTERVAKFAEQSSLFNTRVEIGISIDDLGEHHDKIRGSKNAFEKAVKTFKELKRIQAKSKNLGIGFITTAVKSNQPRLMKLIEYLKSLEPDSIACNIVRGDTKVKEEKDINQHNSKKFSDLCDKYNDYRVKKSYDLFSRMRQAKTLYAHEIRHKMIEADRFQIPCVAGNKIVVMYAEGEVYPCETLGFEIGNIRDYDLDMTKLLQSQRAKSIQKKIIHENCFCTHECFTTANITFSKKQLIKIAARSLFQ
jgi:radical SAM protein with 4Fe4S-binding SPASM domain